MNYQVLNSEITSDPAGLGYAGKNDAQIAALLNAINQTSQRDIIPAYEILEAMDATEFAALSAAQKTIYQIFISAGSVNIKGANTRAAFGAMFGAGTATRAAILALRDVQRSRADALGLGLVTAGDVFLARGGRW